MTADADRLACVLVSHTHWDREWYRPFEAFRARLVDTVDRVLDQLDVDPGWSFLLDGQTVVIEDYLAIRPQRRADLERRCREGRLAIGPWYVQPDSLLPAGETHVRNLLEGRRVGESVGPVSTVGYTPDSFGHPAQFPQLLAGFGIETFVYWRGNGSELDQLPPVWTWLAPDGSSLKACLLAEGYFAAAYLGSDTDVAAARLEKLAAKLAPPGTRNVVFMNGIDHAPPDQHTGEVATALADRTGWEVRRGLLEAYVAAAEAGDARFAGELIGGRIANLLPGVWSTRLYLKARNRDAENELLGWAEPWVALGRILGGPDERPALRLAWRSLLVNQAHDSICGCSTDVVHEQMLGRYDTCIGLAEETTQRVLERLSGLGTTRETPWRDGVDVAVWNPSPYPRTDLVRVHMDGHPVFMIGSPTEEIHPLVLASLFQKGMTVDGVPSRVVVVDDPARVRLTPEQQPWDVEFIAADVPAFGWRRYRLRPGPAAPSTEDDGRRIDVGGLAVEAEADGTLTLTAGGQTWSGLVGLEDRGDRGDTYDADLVDGPDAELIDVHVVRRRHAHGVEELVIDRRVSVPTTLDESRERRSTATTMLAVRVVARLTPGVERLDLDVSVDNTADDHRLRLLFPIGASHVVAATTFDVVARRREEVDDEGWVQRAPSTFIHQGWVAGGGLAVGAPGLPEAELLADGTLAVTLVRAVGWLSRLDVRGRPLPAGPGMPTPGAQCRGLFTRRLCIWPGDKPGAELGLRAVIAGPRPLVAPGVPMLTLSPEELTLSAVKPSEDGDELILRVLNTGDEDLEAIVAFGVRVEGAHMTRLDETAVEDVVTVDGATVTFLVRAHGLATVAVELRP